MRIRYGVRRGPGIVLGLLSGLLVPVALGAFFSATVLGSPCLLLPAVAVGALGIWGGAWALAAASLSCAAAVFLLGGGGGAALLTLLLVAPGWLAYGLVQHSEWDFFKIAWTCAGAQLALTLMLLGMARYLAGEPVSRAFADWLHFQVSIMPWQAPELADAARALSALLGVSLAGLTPLERYQALDVWFSQYLAQLQTTFAWVAVGSAMLTGFAALWLASYLHLRRGEVMVCFISPLDWFLPVHGVIGPPLCALALYLAGRANLAWGEPACLAMLGVCQLLFTGQGLGAVDRMLVSHKVRPAPRTAVLALLYLLASWALMGAGLASAIAGRRGVLTLWLEWRHRDPDE